MKIYPFNTVKENRKDDGKGQMTRLEVNMERLAVVIAFLSVFGFFFKILFF